jgi:hypothetical protein
MTCFVLVLSEQYENLKKRLEDRPGVGSGDLPDHITPAKNLSVLPSSSVWCKGSSKSDRYRHMENWQNEIS